MTPQVSICLTTYNRADSLGRILAGLREQSFADFELIVSDNCSGDRTPEVVAACAARDRRLRYRRNSRNLGMPGNINAAIAEAKGSYIAILHDDDIYRPDLIAQWKSALDANPEAPFVFNDYESLLPSGKHRLYRATAGRALPGAAIARYYFSTFSSCVWGTVMLRREEFEAAGPFDAQFGIASDVDLWLTLACGRDVAYVPEPLITLASDGEERPYIGYPWQQLFWALGTYRRALDRYRHLMPDEVDEHARRLPGKFRRKWIRRIGELVKRRKWREVREGLSLCRDSPDPPLRSLSRICMATAPLPSWYSPGLWLPLTKNE
ncbi:MAG TPA: glycosyltransferase family A protein [Candidatus Binataceae bacterium]|nr:glycosyltransferase family A protein [Candidatus Binataceae bacterium]